MPAVLELDSVAHRFGRLGPLSLRVAEGETLVVLGPSGAGKTTLLRLLLGLLPPDQGTVRFRGEDVARLDPAALRRRIGYVVQGGGLFPHLTVEGNVTFHTAASTAFPQPKPGSAPGPGPMKVPAERLRSVLGLADVRYVQQSHGLAIVDSPLAGAPEDSYSRFLSRDPQLG